MKMKQVMPKFGFPDNDPRIVALHELWQSQTGKSAEDELRIWRKYDMALARNDRASEAFPLLVMLALLVVILVMVGATHVLLGKWESLIVWLIAATFGVVLVCRVLAAFFPKEIRGYSQSSRNNYVELRQAWERAWLIMPYPADFSVGWIDRKTADLVAKISIITPPITSEVSKNSGGEIATLECHRSALARLKVQMALSFDSCHGASRVSRGMSLLLPLGHVAASPS